MSAQERAPEYTNRCLPSSDVQRLGNSILDIAATLGLAHADLEAGGGSDGLAQVVVADARERLQAIAVQLIDADGPHTAQDGGGIGT